MVIHFDMCMCLDNPLQQCVWQESCRAPIRYQLILNRITAAIPLINVSIVYIEYMLLNLY